MISLALPNIDATERLAQRIASRLRDGDVIELHGEVGAGKTAFTGALARALGVLEPVRSPTYTIAHQYEYGHGRYLSHLDCYRATEQLDEEAWGDLEPYFERGIACIEWPEPVREWIAERRRFELHFEIVNLDARIVRMLLPEGESFP